MGSLDLNAARAERLADVEPKSITIDGETFTLPAEAPFVEDPADFLPTLFGEDGWRRFLTHGLSYQDMLAVNAFLSAEYGLDGDGDEADPTVRSIGSAPSSPNTGKPPKRTSKRSTA